MATLYKPQHMITLDGLRGVAALSVLMFHWLIEAGSDWFQYSRLAVDLFFLISGFVMAYSYDQKLRSGMPFSDYFLPRITRLYPLILAGIVLGALRYGLDWAITGEQAFSAKDFMIHLGLNIFMIPIVSLNEDIAMFPLNLVLWSLFYEFLAYAVYGLIIARARTLWLLPVISAGIVGTAAWVLFNFSPDPVVPSHLMFLKQGFIADLARLLVSFFVGVGVFRFMPHLKHLHVGPPIVLGFVCVLIFSQPSNTISPWAILATVFILFPLIVISAVNQNMSGNAARIAKFLGDLSYPLYVTHLPVIWAVRAVLHKLLPDIPIVWLGVVAVPVSIGVAYGLLKLYDEPVRAYLATVLSRPKQFTPAKTAG